MGKMGDSDRSTLCPPPNTNCRLEHDIHSKTTRNQGLVGNLLVLKVQQHYTTLGAFCSCRVSLKNYSCIYTSLLIVNTAVANANMDKTHRCLFANAFVSLLLRTSDYGS